jgi:hypothetical protein
MSEQTNERDTKMTWIEPAVEVLDVRETSTAPGVGGDLQKRYPDCTRS